MFTLQREACDVSDRRERDIADANTPTPEPARIIDIYSAMRHHRPMPARPGYDVYKIGALIHGVD